VFRNVNNVKICVLGVKNACGKYEEVKAGLTRIFVESSAKSISVPATYTILIVSKILF
jgi:hypothetical protein